MAICAYLAEYRALTSEIRGDHALTSIASLASRLPNVPVPLPHAYVYAFVTGILYNATGGGHGPIYLLGELSPKGWWYYVAFALKTPLALLLLLPAAAVLSLRWFRKHPLDESALLVAVVVLLAFFSFACTAQLGIRHVLPAFPFLFVAVGKVAASTPRRHAGAYLADSNVDWGQSDDDLARYLRAPGRGRVAVNPESPVSGRVVVNVNALVGVTVPREKYAWLRDRFEPLDHVAYSWLVYDVPRR